MNEIIAWLDVRKKSVVRANELRITNPSIPPPTSFMSLFPELILKPVVSPTTGTVIVDPELNVMKLASFANNSLMSIMAQSLDRAPPGPPLNAFSSTELDSAFGFACLRAPKMDTVDGGGGGPKPPPKRTSSSSHPHPAHAKRSRPSSTSASSPTPPLPSSPFPPTHSSLSSPKPPLPPPLPPMRTPPPLPPPKPPVTTTTTTSTTTPQPPIATVATLSLGTIMRTKEENEDADSSSDVDLDLQMPLEATSGPETMSALKKELLRTVNALIYISNWPKPTHKLWSTFKSSNFPGGNPFAVFLKPQSRVVPDSYFDLIQNPIDLSTIKQRVEENFYLTLKMFETDVELVVSNALLFNKEGSFKMMAEHLQSMTKKELTICYNRLYVNSPLL